MGFGSAPPPRPLTSAAGGGVEDLTKLFSSTLTSVGRVAESAARTASEAVKT